jgi:cytochrome b561
MSAVSDHRRVPWLPILFGVLVVGLTAVLLYRGWSFYVLSLEDRVEHPEFRKLRPSGLIGNGYGWVASLLVVLNLSYLVRRRLAGSRLGSMRVWLDIHVFTGLTAAVLVTFHSAFQLRTPVATTSAASLGVVVVTGLIGRFLYALTPAGDRQRLREAFDQMEAAWPGHRAALVAAIDALPGPTVPSNASLLRSLLAIPKWRRIARKRREALGLILPRRAELDGRQRRAVKELVGAAAAEASSSGMSALLRSWRGLHRFFALLMLASVLLHAGIAWYYGYRWIFA